MSHSHTSNKDRAADDVAPLARTPQCAVHVLDVGAKQYGDCLLLTFQGSDTTPLHVLVDGAHPGDHVSPGDGHVPIPDQLRHLLETPSNEPIQVDVLVVTHCHSDHYGCLPAMVDLHWLHADWALVADADLGFGRITDPAADDEGDNLGDEANDPPALRRLVGALRAEPLGAEADAEEVRALLDAGETEEQAYRRMLRKLAERGTKVISYVGEETPVQPLRDFCAQRGVTFDIIGPGSGQLQVCAREIRRGHQRARSVARALFDEALAGSVFLEEAGSAAAEDAWEMALDEVEAYRQLARQTRMDENEPNLGAALNDQSLVLCFSHGEHRLLLTGDMQFAVPELQGLNDEVEKLLDAVREQAPYSLVKIAHHASSDAFNSAFMDAVGTETKLFAISTGKGSRHHPSGPARDLLRANRERIRWVRNDRNGPISIWFPASGEPKVDMLGDFNDLSGPQGLRQRRQMRSDMLPGAAGVVFEAAADDTGPADVPLEQDPLLRRHVINLTRGRLSTSSFRTSEADLQQIFSVHLPAYQSGLAAGTPARIVIYAHGGLVSERDGLLKARQDIQWWLDNDVYPLFFVWETGLLDVLGNRLRSALFGADEGVAFAAEDAPERFADPVVELIARNIGVPTLWNDMKVSARAAIMPGGGGARTLDLLVQWLLSLPAGAPAELHAVGHSAGAIFHSHLLPAYRARAAARPALPAIRSLHLLAPAITLADFESRLLPLLGPGHGVDSLSIFTMNDEAERNDVCRVRSTTLYNKSLLYLIHRALEPRHNEPLLGLQNSLTAAASHIRVALGLAANANAAPGSVLFAPTDGAAAPAATRATEHGGFDDDSATMTSILCRIKGLPDSTSVVPYPETLFGAGEATVAAAAEEDMMGRETAEAIPDAMISTLLAGTSLSVPRSHSAAALLRALANYLDAQSGSAAI